MNVEIVLRHRVSCSITQESHKTFKNIKNIHLTKNRMWLIFSDKQDPVNFPFNELLTFQVFG